MFHNYFKLVICALVLITTYSFSQSGTSLLQGYNFSDHQVRQVELNSDLDEISGLCKTNDHRVFSHTDEEAVIYQLDLESGDIIKSFKVGEKTVEEDFEDIAFVDDFFYLVTSSGDIYRFREGKDDQEVLYAYFRTPLNKDYDVEGLCYYPPEHSLILACKEYPGKKLEGTRAFYAFDLNSLELQEDPRFVISLNDLRMLKKETDSFKPSGIIYNANTASFIIISGPSNTIVETDNYGNILSIKQLNPDMHRQAEGIIILKDQTILISDEADKKKPTLTYYKQRN